MRECNNIANSVFSLKKAVMEVERDAIKQALEIAGWNKSKAASMLSIDYKTLLTKIKKYEIVKSTRQQVKRKINSA